MDANGVGSSPWNEIASLQLFWHEHIKQKTGAKRNQSSLFAGLIYFCAGSAAASHASSCDNLQVAVHPQTKHMQISRHASRTANVFLLSVGVIEWQSPWSVNTAQRTQQKWECTLAPCATWGTCQAIFKQGGLVNIFLNAKRGPYRTSVPRDSLLLLIWIKKLSNISCRYFSLTRFPAFWHDTMCTLLQNKLKSCILTE